MKARELLVIPSLEVRTFSALERAEGGEGRSPAHRGHGHPGAFSALERAEGGEGDEELDRVNEAFTLSVLSNEPKGVKVLRRFVRPGAAPAFSALERAEGGEGAHTRFLRRLSRNLSVLSNEPKGVKAP